MHLLRRGVLFSTLEDMAKPLYHLHLDAAHLPAPLLDHLIQEGGFHFDDFPHEIEVGGKSYPARHLTKYLYAPANSETAKKECELIDSWVRAHDFRGFIQCEYVMEDAELEGSSSPINEAHPPLFMTTRPLSGEGREGFKKHELHLELVKTQTSPAVIEALEKSGFHILENERTITFTASGNPRELLKIRKVLRSFLRLHQGSITGKFTYEATAYWSLYGVESPTLPAIVDSVEVH